MDYCCNNPSQDFFSRILSSIRDHRDCFGFRRLTSAFRLLVPSPAIWYCLFLHQRSFMHMLFLSLFLFECWIKGQRACCLVSEKVDKKIREMKGMFDVFCLVCCVMNGKNRLFLFWVKKVSFFFVLFGFQLPSKFWEKNKEKMKVSQLHFIINLYFGFSKSKFASKVG